MICPPGWDILGPKIKKWVSNNWQGLVLLTFMSAIATFAIVAIPELARQCREDHREKHRSYMVEITAVKSEITGPEVGIAKVHELVYCTNLKDNEPLTFINGEGIHSVTPYDAGERRLLVVEIQEPMPKITEETEITKDAVWHGLEEERPEVERTEEEPFTLNDLWQAKAELRERVEDGRQ